MNTAITAGEWEEGCIKAQVQINTRFKLSLYKWIIRTCVTPYLLNPNVPDYCVKCSVEKGTLFRSLLERLRNISWKDVLDIQSQILSEKLPVCPQMCISERLEMNKTKKKTDNILSSPS